MKEILRGGADKATEAGIAIVGGHSIDDAEPKFGLSVIGVVAPERAVRNSSARAGDVLILTKPIGTGVVSQGIKKCETSDEDAAVAIKSMAELNRAACDAMIEVGVSAATDVTGFGLIGHLHEVVHSSALTARIRAGAVPLLPGARALAERGAVPGGSKRNAQHFGRFVRWSDSVDGPMRTLLCDAQTSGGLLVCVPASRADALRAALDARAVRHATIGALESGEPGAIIVET
jgi:selenide,water dikinase